jgi:quinol monooxygenase YgiN
MLKYALYAHLEAKPGKEAELEALLKGAQPMTANEPGTVTWYAFTEAPGHYGIFDTFETEEAREAHLNGPIAKALIDNAEKLLSKPPAIHKIEVLASKR